MSSSFPWGQLPTPTRMYGTATVGERGQVSIPVDARKELAIEPGDRVVVFGNRLNGAVLLVKADIFEDFAGFFMAKLNKIGRYAHDVFDQFLPGETADGPADEAPATDGPVAEPPATDGPVADAPAKDRPPTTRRRRPA